MLAIRQIQDDGSGQVFLAKSVEVSTAHSTTGPSKTTMTAVSENDVPGYFETGRIFVMNEMGKTIAKYELGPVTTPPGEPEPSVAPLKKI